ncbi:Cu2+-exporting ATPase [Alteromonadaceae bacterium Bs31]|nr:Cu2+-exporting ATPase [Alteromonadaceae bacterium Bs31]
MSVAQLIHEGGLDGYYRFRDEAGNKPDEAQHDFHAYDLPEVQAQFVSEEGEGIKTARLSVQGIHCAACAWLIEQFLEKHPAVKSVRVNASNRSCILRWDSQQSRLSDLMAQVQRIGYKPQPEQQQQRQAQQRKETHLAMMRLGVAGIGMMQVGMVAVALYAGGIQGIDDYWQVFLRWVSLVIATPVVLFSARPFFHNAFRALKMGRLNMDVPVSLAISLAYGASAWATFTRSGEVYFDSVSMFTFFLLLGRFLEMRARNSSSFASENLQQLLPLSASRIHKNEKQAVPLAALKAGDRVWVASGETIPADGKLCSAFARVDESLLTGESKPQRKNAGDSLAAGTQVTDQALEMLVEATGSSTKLSAIENLVRQAGLEKPRQAALADRIAAHFVAAVLTVSVITGICWWFIDAEKAFWVVLSVLVVTCPCALSLATPAALTAGVNRARALGILITGPQAMEVLHKIDTVAFDKTGTLTEGKIHIQSLIFAEPEHSFNESEQEHLLDIIAALEKPSSHPIAAAFAQREQTVLSESTEVIAGQGVKGIVGGVEYRFGKPDFAVPGRRLDCPVKPAMWQLLARKEGDEYLALVWLGLNDNLRADALNSVDTLRSSRYSIALLSGDRASVVSEIASQLALPDALAELQPEQKLQWLQAQQQQGHKVLMVGDGINDVPVLSAADVSMAMGEATQLAQSKADSILLNGRLSTIPLLIELAHRVQRIVRQNLAWALLYNLLALPAAAMGLLPPYLAAIGMSFSSLLVVLNATRL